MDRPTTLALRFEPDFTHVDAARKAIGQFCRDAFGDVAVSRMEDLCLAATEAMNNAVEHSGAQAISLELTATETGVILSIVNDGRRFDPTQHTAMPSFDDDADLPEGGFGLALVRALVDELSYAHRDGLNILCLRKTLRDGEKA